MAKYLVTVEARLSYALVSEVYEVEATNVDKAEKLILDGGGELLEERVLDGETVEEYVTQVCTFTAGDWVCS